MVPKTMTAHVNSSSMVPKTMTAHVNSSSMVPKTMTVYFNTSSMSINKTATMTFTPSHNVTITSHHNMTVTPSQTMPTPSVTPTPTPTPTSTPIPPRAGNFTVKKNNTVCLFAYMAASFDVTMNFSKVWKYMYLFSLFSNGTSIQQNLDITKYNKVLVITNDFIYPSNSKMYGKEPLYNKTLVQQTSFARPLNIFKSRFQRITITTGLSSLVHTDIYERERNSTLNLFYYLTKYSRLLITRTFKGNQKKLESSGV